MSLINTLQARAERVVLFPSVRVAFRVRAVSSKDLARHRVAALIATKGPKRAPEADRDEAEALQARRKLAELQGQIKALSAKESLTPDAALVVVDLWTEVAAQGRVLQQYQSRQAARLGEEGAEKRAFLHQALACAGVVAGAEWSESDEVDGEPPAPEGLTWEPLALANLPQDECPDGVLSVDAIPWAVAALASAVDELSKEDAGAQLAPFRGGAGPAAAAGPSGGAVRD